jgi:Chaperone of endosialidase
MKNTLRTTVLAACVALLLPTLSFAQLYVDGDSEVGIGTSTPTSKLDVINSHPTDETTATFLNISPSSSLGYGIVNKVDSSSTGNRYGIDNTVLMRSGYLRQAYGIKNQVVGANSLIYGLYNVISQPASASVSTTRGVYNQISAEGNAVAYGEYTSVNGDNAAASGTRYGNYIYVENIGTGTKYGVYANASGSTNYAGFFDGNVTVTGTFTNPSDARTKTGIAPITSALSTVRRLSPKTYQYRQDLGINLPVGQQFGFVAQELEQVLPQMVSEVALSPGHADDEASADDASAKQPALSSIKSVNYIGLIPILTQAVQELAAQLDAKDQAIQALETRLNAQEQAIKALQAGRR